MHKNKIVVFIISLLLVISIGFNIQTMLVNQKSNYITNLTQYEKIIRAINENFKAEGYKEILGNYNHVLALPQNSNDDDLINRQKLFVFKNSSKNSVILLDLSVSKYNSKENDEWSHSFDYSPEYFNSNKKDSKFKESYNPNLTPIQIATNSFNCLGCNFALLAYTNDNGNNQSVASQELISFSNQIIDFIQKQIK